MAENLKQAETSPETDSQARRPGPNLTVFVLLVAAVVALVLVGWLAMQRFQIPNPLAPAPTATDTPAPEPAAVSPPPVAQATATPTRVVVEAGPSPTAPPTATPTLAIVEVSAPVISERIRNGSFEDGFEDHSVGLGWTPFTNGGAIFEFLEETWPPAVLDGQHAQRIQVREASQPDRHAGIHQTVRVVSGETYNLTLHGQIRSGEGDIRISQYGYRMQLGIDYSGQQDWTAVEDWIELPWDEQRFDSDFLFFYDYSTPLVATGPRLTIFIRTWNKWPDPGRVEYTLDGISLRGPTPFEEMAFDQPLPLTGDAPSVTGRVRVLGSAVVVGLLLAGAIWQLRRRLTGGW
ncbi:MAG: hypothetical protein Kow0063_37060 [Anaerolineae bacterium]